KIDRSFIITMLKEPDTMTLVSTMISLARALRLKVIAEGVDAEDQANFLRLARCAEMQGYLLGKPVPRGRITALLRTEGAVERTARVGHRARVPGHAARNTRIEGAAPHLADDVDVLRRIAARAHRPEHFEKIRRVDVVVDHDDEPSEIGTRLAARRGQRGLLG